jgi:hypothetical protein
MKTLRTIVLLGAVALLTGCAGEIVVPGPGPVGPPVVVAPGDPWWFDGSDYYYYDPGLSVYFYWDGGRRVYLPHGWAPHGDWRGRGNPDFGRGGWHGGPVGRPGPVGHPGRPIGRPTGGGWRH